MKKIVIICSSLFVLLGVFTGCTNTSNASNTTTVSNTSITEAEVLAAQKAWGDGIIAIGEAKYTNGDYITVAQNMLDALYGYKDNHKVLFKPTKAAEDEFRETEEEALSYFVATGVVKEDHGFALEHRKEVRFQNNGIIIDTDSATAMGNYYFVNAETNEETKVDYTFAYYKDANGKLKINVHHSSLPYAPAEAAH